MKIVLLETQRELVRKRMNPSQTKLYAAYGSNTNLKQMQKRCPKAKVVGKGVLNNYRLTFRGTNNGVANIEECNGRSVPVVMWRITEACEKALDVYEGFPRLYIKKNIEVETSESAVSAMVYLMAKEYEKMPARPNEHYLNIITEGFEEHGLAQDILKKAYEECLQEINSGIL